MLGREKFCTRVKCLPTFFVHRVRRLTAFSTPRDSSLQLAWRDLSLLADGLSQLSPSYQARWLDKFRMSSPAPVPRGNRRYYGAILASCPDPSMRAWTSWLRSVILVLLRCFSSNRTATWHHSARKYLDYIKLSFDLLFLLDCLNLLLINWFKLLNIID